MAAVGAAVAAGELAVTRPAEAPLSCIDAGVYGSSLALRLAREEGRPAEQVAGVIARRLEAAEGIDRVEVTGPGFLTIVVAEPEALAASIVAAGQAYAKAEVPRAGRPWADRPRTFDNPGFVVRYAYARATAIQRRAVDLGVAAGDPAPLSDPYEQRLLRDLAELPSRSAQAVRERDAEPLKRHLERVADAYHEVYERCPALPIGEERPGAMHQARRTLAEATRIALANGLHMIGEEPRERI